MIKPRPASTFLRAAPIIQRLQASLRDQEQLLRLVRALLPSPLDLHCLSVQQKESRLILHADSSAWASRLRYFSRDLRIKLRDKGLPVQKIEVRVLISNQPKKHSVRCAESLSTDNAELIKAVAETVQDSDLRAALQRLSRHGRS